MIVHVVLMKFPDPSQAEEAERLLAGLAGEIDVVRRLVVGRNAVETPNSYDLGLVVEFDSLEDLEVYRDHPAHESVAQYLRQHRSAVASSDFPA